MTTERQIEQIVEWLDEIENLIASLRVSLARLWELENKIGSVE